MRRHLGTSGQLVVDDIADHLRNLIVSRFADHLAESKIPALDLAMNYDELGAGLQEKLNVGFDDQGMQLVQMTIDNILPSEVEEALDARTKMAAIGNLDAYTKLQAAEALPIAAANEGGMAGAGVGMGAGFAMGNLMGNAMAPGMVPGVGNVAAAPAAAGAAPAAGGSDDIEAKLEKVAKLLSKGLITAEEAAARREKLLDEL